MLRLYLSDASVTGLLAFERGVASGVSKDLEDHDDTQPVVEWSMKRLTRRLFCLRADFPTEAYRPERVIDGYKRPYGGPHMWLSEPMPAAAAEEAALTAGGAMTAGVSAAVSAGGAMTAGVSAALTAGGAVTDDAMAMAMADAAEQPAPWIELSWDRPREIRELHLIFNDDVNEDLINLHHHRTPFEVIPELVKSYRIEVLADDGSWIPVLRETGNRRRKRVHTLARPLTAAAVRLVIKETHGSAYAEVIEIRVYG
ncbi:hypothetical protein D1872_219700 [compost metagenome]